MTSWYCDWNSDDLSPSCPVALDLPLPRPQKRPTMPKKARPSPLHLGPRPKTDREQAQPTMPKKPRRQRREQQTPDSELRDRVLDTLSVFNERYAVPAGVVAATFVGGSCDVRRADVIRVLDDLERVGLVIKVKMPGGPPVYSLAPTATRVTVPNLGHDDARAGSGDGNGTGRPGHGPGDDHRRDLPGRRTT